MAEHCLIPNLLHFGNLLRDLGLPITVEQIEIAAKAVDEFRMFNKDDFYWVLASSLVSRKDDISLFDDAFSIFWHQPGRQEGVEIPASGDVAKITVSSRQEVTPNKQKHNSTTVPSVAAMAMDDPSEDADTIPESTATYSAHKRIKQIDFEKLNASELEVAKRMIVSLKVSLPSISNRRYKPFNHGTKMDFRASIREMVRASGSIHPIKWQKQKRRQVPILVLCDISGSMERYSRMFLIFMHVLKRAGLKTNCFVFGTGLTNIDRPMNSHHLETAMTKVENLVTDWSSGTRIGASLGEFNKTWNRRILDQGALVFLISDGLDQDDAIDVELQMQRLQKSSRKIIWLNPLLRHQGYEPLASGAKAILPHVDQILPIYNVKSLENLSRYIEDYFKDGPLNTY